MPGRLPSEIIDRFRELADVCLNGNIPRTIPDMETLKSKLNELSNGTINWVEEQQLFNPIREGILTYTQASQTFEALNLVPVAEGKMYSVTTWRYISVAVDLKASLHNLEQQTQYCSMDQALYNYTDIFWKISRWVFNVVNLKESKEIVEFFSTDDSEPEITFNSLRKLFALRPESMLTQHPCIAAMEENPTLLSNAYLAPLIVGSAIGPKPPLPTPTEVPPQLLPTGMSVIAPTPPVVVLPTLPVGISQSPLGMPHPEIGNMEFSKKYLKKGKKKERKRELAARNLRNLDNRIKMAEKKFHKKENCLAAIESMILGTHERGTTEAHQAVGDTMAKLLTLRKLRYQVDSSKRKCGGKKAAKRDPEHQKLSAYFVSERQQAIKYFTIADVTTVCNELRQPDKQPSIKKQEVDLKTEAIPSIEIKKEDNKEQIQAAVPMVRPADI